MTIRNSSRLALVAGVSLLSLQPVYAQSAGQPAEQAQASPVETGDIIVTAQKRSESAQKAAVAIAAVSGESLQRRQITSIASLAPSLPNVTFGEEVGIARIAIRGLGTDTSVPAQEGRVAYHTDGVYISRTTAPLSTFFDIDRVEVVYGPQGTLYGRNATAGAINVITSDPGETFGGYMHLRAGNYGLFTEDGALTGPLTDTVSARLAFTRTDRDGYGRDLFTGQQIDNEHSFAVRGKIKIEPSNNFKWVLSADYSKADDAASFYHYLGQGSPDAAPRSAALGGTTPSNPRDAYANAPQRNYTKFYGFGSDLKLDLGAVSLTSVTGLRHSYTELSGDTDGTQANVGMIHYIEDSSQFSEELRLNGKISNIKWIVGGYYFHEKIYGQADYSPILDFTNNYQSQGLLFNGHFKTVAGAAFGQIDWDIVNGLTLSAGLRYSREKRSIKERGAIDFVAAATPNFIPNYFLFENDSATFSSTTPKFTIQYQAAPKVLTYATYSKGFKSGGFSLTTFSSAVLPEVLTDYEVGLKSDWLNGRLRFNASAFYYQYKNLQVEEILAAGAIFVNAAAAHLKGIEAELIIRPVPGFEISGNVSYLDSTFTSFALADPSRPSLGTVNLAGNQLPEAPKHAANAAAQYSFAVPRGQLVLRGEISYTDRVYFSPFNRRDVSQAAYAKGNILATYTGDNGISASLWVRNIANLRTISSAQVTSGFLGYPISGGYDAPRTFGGSIGYRF